jgi:hypothetical protein
MAAPDTTAETGKAGASAASVSDRVTENTRKLCQINANSLLPCSGVYQAGGRRLKWETTRPRLPAWDE